MVLVDTKQFSFAFAKKTSALRKYQNDVYEKHKGR